jgi:hypothetical protein
MEREAEELPLLGVVGEEAFNILLCSKAMEREEEELPLLGGEEALNILLCSSRSELVRTLAFTLLLPLSFATLLLCLMAGRLELYKSNQHTVCEVAGLVQPITWESRGFPPLWTTNGVFEFWMLSTAAVMYTAASMYTANAVSFANTMTVVPRFWKRLAVTFLWFFTIVLAHTTAYILAFFLLMYYTVGFDKYVNSREFRSNSIPILAFFFCVLVYINMIGYLASFISVLQEQYYSLAAMLERKHLIKGKRTTVLSLVMLYFVFIEGVGHFLYSVARLEDCGGAGIVARAVHVSFLGGLLCLVMFWGLVVQTEL